MGIALIRETGKRAGRSEYWRGFGSTRDRHRDMAPRTRPGPTGSRPSTGAWGRLTISDRAEPFSSVGR